MNSVTSFDAAKFYLGNLCRNGHDYESSGQSLRYLNNKRHPCVDCKLAGSKREYHADIEKSREHGREKQKRLRNIDLEAARLKEREYRNKTYASRREHILAQQKSYYKADPERFKRYCKAYYESSEEVRLRLIARAKAWKEANPELAKASRTKWSQSKQGKLSKKVHKHKRRATEAQAHRVPYTTKDLQTLWQQFNEECAYCGCSENLTVDHLIAISQGGTDTMGNLLVACGRCNSSKAQSSVETWYKRQPFFSVPRWKKIQKHFGLACDGQLTLF